MSIKLSGILAPYGDYPITESSYTKGGFHEVPVATLIDCNTSEDISILNDDSWELVLVALTSLGFIVDYITCYTTDIDVVVTDDNEVTKTISKGTYFNGSKIDVTQPNPPATLLDAALSLLVSYPKRRQGLWLNIPNNLYISDNLTILKAQYECNDIGTSSYPAIWSLVSNASMYIYDSELYSILNIDNNSRTISNAIIQLTNKYSSSNVGTIVTFKGYSSTSWYLQYYFQKTEDSFILLDTYVRGYTGFATNTTTTNIFATLNPNELVTITNDLTPGSLWSEATQFAYNSTSNNCYYKTKAGRVSNSFPSETLIKLGYNTVVFYPNYILVPGPTDILRFKIDLQPIDYSLGSLFYGFYFWISNIWTYSAIFEAVAPCALLLNRHGLKGNYNFLVSTLILNSSTPQSDKLIDTSVLFLMPSEYVQFTVNTKLLTSNSLHFNQYNTHYLEDYYFPNNDTSIYIDRLKLPSTKRLIPSGTVTSGLSYLKTDETLGTFTFEEADETIFYYTLTTTLTPGSPWPAATAMPKLEAHSNFVRPFAYYPRDSNPLLYYSNFEDITSDRRITTSTDILSNSLYSLARYLLAAELLGDNDIINLSASTSPIYTNMGIQLVSSAIMLKDLDATYNSLQLNTNGQVTIIATGQWPLFLLIPDNIFTNPIPTHQMWYLDNAHNDYLYSNPTLSDPVWAMANVIPVFPEQEITITWENHSITSITSSNVYYNNYLQNVAPYQTTIASQFTSKSYTNIIYKILNGLDITVTNPTGNYDLSDIIPYETDNRVILENMLISPPAISFIIQYTENTLTKTLELTADSFIPLLESTTSIDITGIKLLNANGFDSYSYPTFTITINDTPTTDITFEKNIFAALTVDPIDTTLTLSITASGPITIPNYEWTFTSQSYTIPLVYPHILARGTLATSAPNVEIGANLLRNYDLEFSNNFSNEAPHPHYICILSASLSTQVLNKDFIIVDSRANLEIPVTQLYVDSEPLFTINNSTATYHIFKTTYVYNHWFRPTIRFI